MNNNITSIRKYPYPYKAALSICSDIDQCDVSTFLKLHCFINTTQDTKCGPGLGLDIGDSFWFYSDNPNEMSYFEGYTEKRSRAGEIIEEFIRAGYIDCLHSYGNFGACEPERNVWRKLVVNGINRLKRESLIVDTWINHGHNKSNLMSMYHPEFKGDDPNSELYHYDLLKEYGIRYAWLNELSDALIHDVRYLNAPLDITGAQSEQISKNICRNIFSSGKRRIISKVNKVIEPVILRDNNIIMSFKRYHKGTKKGIWYGAQREGLSRQLNKETINHLFEREGTMIVYTHFGRTSVPSQAKLFDQDTIDSLEHLAEEYHSGRVFVTTTSRLLNFVTVRDCLKWRGVLGRDNVMNIHIDSIRNAMDEDRKAKRADMNGICFRLKNKCKVRIWVGDIEIEPDFTLKQEGDSYLTGFEYPRLRYPAKYSDINSVTI